MNNSIEGDTRIRIAQFLPSAIAFALQSYESFASGPISDEEPKNFSAHHNACKVAIAHIELLIKLAKWVDQTQQDSNLSKADQQAFQSIMQSAQQELDAFNKSKEKK